MFLTDLNEVREIMKPLYSEKPRGSKPRDPAAMLRSMLLMKSTGEQSITEWVKKLNQFDNYAILSGFEPNNVPGVGTFYDFIDRISLIDDDEKNRQRDLVKYFRPKPKKTLRKNEKLPPKHPDIINRLVDRIFKSKDQPVHPGNEKIIQKVFSECFVIPSAEIGLLGDTQKMMISADGTLVRTAASHYGIKICNCKANGIHNCDCKRRSSDINARWGWDSYREIWVYGYNFFEINACGGRHDLPIYFIRTQAQRNDGVSSVIALYRVKKLFPQFNITKFAGDKAMDNYGFYRLLNYYNIESFIPLNKTRSGQFTYQELDIDKNGTPTCSGGFKLAFNGYCPDRMRVKWRCPFKAQANFPAENEKVCKYLNYCTKSSYGRTYYTYPKDNYRVFTSIPRDSEQWKQNYKKRTSSERSNKRKKVDYKLKHERIRGDYRWFFQYGLSAMCQHIDAWFTESKINFKNLCADWEKEAQTSINPSSSY